MIRVLPLVLATVLATPPASAWTPQVRGQSDFTLLRASHGFGPVLPHRILAIDAAGQPTQTVVEVRKLRDLVANVTPSNSVLPVTSWPTAAELPGGAAGNHFIYLEFSEDLDLDSILSSSAGSQALSGLLGPIQVVAVDGGTGAVTPVRGRALVGGQTYGSPDPNNPGQLLLETWVSESNGGPVANQVNGSQPGLGFPFTESGGRPAASRLLRPSAFVFIPDLDGDLATHETFPSGVTLQVRVTTQVRSVSGQQLAEQANASAVVGQDSSGPNFSLVSPLNGAINVAPDTSILLKTTEPVQPQSLGALKPPATLSPAVQIQVGPLAQTWNVPFTALPVSPYDLTEWELTPAFEFPGQGSGGVGACTGLGTVTVGLFPFGLRDLPGNPGSAANSTVQFEVGEGAGVVNAPIAPDAIYVARTGPAPALSVLDLNGFGQSTGDPFFDFSGGTFPEGSSNFPNNPNLIQYGPNLHPPLFPGTCSVNGGSGGAFTLTRNTNLSDRLLTTPQIMTVGDMALGHSLDQLFNNGKDTGGCQSGGGNFCAVAGKKLVDASPVLGGGIGPTSQVVPNGANHVVPGGANPISFAPHPNPPPLIFPPLCSTPFIGGQEPTSSYSFTLIQNGGLGLHNLLAPGDWQGNPAQGIPPSGILPRRQNAWFVGPDRASLPNSGPCMDHQFRQQIGHLLYVIDRARREVVVLNSNRMQVLDRIPVADPTELAMSPNLDTLAVSSQVSSEVFFIDTDPASPTFNRVTDVAQVGAGPRGIAWDPGNEDVIVCNEGEGTLSILSAATFTERKRVGAGLLNQPFDVVISQRQEQHGTRRNVYFAWILDRTGELWMFESGPDGVNGWGYDDVIGKADFTFKSPQRIALDVTNLKGGAWVLHEEPLDLSGAPTGELGGAVTRVEIVSSFSGRIPLVPGFPPQFRSMSLEVAASFGESVLTGLPVDLAFDDQINYGVLPNVTSPFSAGTPLAINGKSQVKALSSFQIVPAKDPGYLFLAVPNSSEGPGVIDVIDLSTLQRVDTNAYAPGVQSVQAYGAIGLADYWSQ